MASNHAEMMVFLDHLNKEHNGHFDEHCLVCQMLAKPLRRENYDEKTRKRKKHDYSSMNMQFTEANIRHYKNLTLFKYDDVSDDAQIISRSQLGIAFLSREEYSLEFIAYMTGLTMMTLKNYITKMKRNKIFKHTYYPNDGLNNNNAFYRHSIEYALSNYKNNQFSFYKLMQNHVLAEDEINCLMQNNYNYYRTLNQTRINYHENTNNVSPIVLLQLKNDIEHQVLMNNTSAQLGLDSNLVKHFYNQSDFSELDNAIMYQTLLALFTFDEKNNKYCLKNSDYTSTVEYLALLLNAYLLKINCKDTFINYFGLTLKSEINKSKSKAVSLARFNVTKLMDLIYQECVHLIQEHPELFQTKHINRFKWNNHNTLNYEFTLQGNELIIN